MNQYELIKDAVDKAADEGMSTIELVIMKKELENDPIYDHIVAYIEDNDLNGEPETHTG